MAVLQHAHRHEDEGERQALINPQLGNPHRENSYKTSRPRRDPTPVKRTRVT